MSLFKRISNQLAISDEKKKKTNLLAEFKSDLQEGLDWAKDEYEGMESELDRFHATLQEALSAHMPEKILDEGMNEEMDEEEKKALVRNAKYLFHISEDKMQAFACVLPPVNGGAEMDVEPFEKSLRYSGISKGIDSGAVQGLIKEQDYLSIVRLAKGTPAKDGADGSITEHFERKARIEIGAVKGGSIDFNEEITMQAVSADGVICFIQQAEKAIDGMDVVGNVLKGKDGADVEVTAGPNTYLSADGKQLLSSVDGAVSLTKEGHFCVMPQRTVLGHAGRHTGNLYHKGDLYISGNVSGDIVIKADGDLIIGGEVKDAQIKAGGNIRIQKGITKGMAETTITAGGQIQCAVIEGVEVEAEGDVYAGVILNSDVTAGGSVYATSDNGLIIGGSIRAHDNVAAKEIGNLSECANHILVGYEPELKAELDKLKASQKESKSTLEMLHKNISTLKAVGSHLPQEKKELLVKLEEQRKLYETREEELAAEIKSIVSRLRKSAEGTVSCEKMHPVTEIHIGEKKTVINRAMEPCRVFMNGDTIVAR